MTHDASGPHGPDVGPGVGALPPALPASMAPSVGWDPLTEPASGPILALDLGGTYLRTAVVTPDGAVLGRGQRRTPRGAASAVVEAAVRSLRQSVVAAREAHAARGIAFGDLIGLGISAPGPIDLRRGALVDPPNMHETFWGLPLGPILAERLGVPAFLERDTHVAALAEAAFGRARGLSDFVYLTISTGIGGGVVTGGRLMIGPDGVAGELGHLTVDIDGPECGCGARGHLERLSSGSGMARSGHEALADGSATPVLREIAARIAPAPLEGRHLAEAEERGDPIATRILERGRQAFAAAMVSIVDVFDPELVICGGGVAIAQGDRLLGPARDEVRAHAFRIQARRARIELAALGDDVGLVGALPLVVTRLAGAGAAARPHGAASAVTEMAPHASAVHDNERSTPAPVG